MSLEFLIYLASVAKDFSSLFLVIGLVLSAAALVSGLRWEGKDLNFYIKDSIPWFASSFISLIFAAAIPDKEAIYLIAATKAVRESEISNKLYTVLNNKLDEMLKEKK